MGLKPERPSGALPLDQAPAAGEGQLPIPGPLPRTASPPTPCRHCSSHKVLIHPPGRSGQVHPPQRKLPHPPHLLPAERGAGQPAPRLPTASEGAGVPGLPRGPWSPRPAPLLLPTGRWAPTEGGGPRSATGLCQGLLQECPPQVAQRGSLVPTVGDPLPLPAAGHGRRGTPALGLAVSRPGGQPPGQQGWACSRACRMQGRGARSVGKRERGDCDSIKANMLQSTSSP